MNFCDDNQAYVPDKICFPFSLLWLDRMARVAYIWIFIISWTGIIKVINL